MQNLIKEAKRYAAILDRVIETSPPIFDYCAQGAGTATINGLHHAIMQAEKDTVTAAAPELLEALENLVKKYDAMHDGNIIYQLTNGDFFAARAAIAKAKGETE